MKPHCPKHGIPDCSPLLNGCSWRPPPWPDEPSDLEGYVYRWFPEGDDWRLVEQPKRCRRKVGKHYVCTAPAIAELNRRRNIPVPGTWLRETRDAWWAYCADHLYGRRVADGRIWQRRLVEAPAEGPVR